MTASDNPFVFFAIVLSDFFEWRLLTRLLSLPLYFLTSLNDGFWPVCYLCHCIVWLLWMTASDPFVIFAIVLSDFFEWRLLTRLLSLPLYFLTSLNDGFWPVCYLCHCIVWLLWMTASEPFVIFAIVLSDFFKWRFLTRLLSLPLYYLTSLNDGFWSVCYLCHCFVWLLSMTTSDPFVIFKHFLLGQDFCFIIRRDPR
jgi:hypothetical protein